MTHEDCMAILVRPDPGPATRREAEEHVARCSDCWAVLSLLHRLTAGEPPADAERMAALFGCGPVQDEMYLLGESTAEEIQLRHPDLARHVSWCHACRGRLGEILVIERAAARGELGPPLLARHGPEWREVRRTAAEIVREAVGRVVVELRRATAVFSVVPEGFVIHPAAPVGALRGSPSEKAIADEVGRVQQVRFTVVESELSAELTLQPEGSERVGLVVQLAAPGRPRLSLHLRELRPDGTDLVARYTAHENAPTIMKGLAPGRYLLEIEDKQKARRFQLRFDIEASV